MRLKIATTTFFLTGMALLALWPWLVGPRPPEGAPRPELAKYARRMSLYVVGTLTSLTLAAICALLIVRKVRLEFRDRSRENFEELIESTLRDHGRK
ncbi:MAG: hypothetical protein KJZ62_06210 [Fimbriimonadaceae bacterium]|nr:hypothetical protein [Fimbriimonadaceae bacterium]MCC6352049.1 hypothetical protein [Fimbriimonadaceae bacterium]MCL4284678.1 hypothetical protein [Fimbriimonadaceae bacterium]QOJ11689.1 MAG: hypothetical protein HRU74_06320 [Chthonomonadaceae bacterium]